MREPGWPLHARAASVGDADGRSAVISRLLAGLPGDPNPLYPEMSKLNVETFRAPVMIVASFGSYLVLSGHDHEDGPPSRRQGSSRLPVASPEQHRSLVRPRPRRGRIAPPPGFGGPARRACAAATAARRR